MSCTEDGVAKIELKTLTDLRSLRRDYGRQAPTPLPLGEGREGRAVREASQQLKEYFAGSRKEFALPLDVAGTPFQKAVWKAIAKIPYGETRSYKQIAQAIKRPTAYRAVAQAIGANPVAIIIPCHRVIASPGSTQPLGGYAWGLAWKKKLLTLEGCQTN